MRPAPECCIIASVNTKRMKVWITNDGNIEMIVAAPSKKEAAAAMKRSLYSFNAYASDLPEYHPLVAVAMERPGVALMRTNQKHHHDPLAEWVERR